MHVSLEVAKLKGGEGGMESVQSTSQITLLFSFTPETRPSLCKMGPGEEGHMMTLFYLTLKSRSWGWVG